MLLAFARNLKRKTRRLRAHGRAGSALHTAAAEMMSDGHDDAVHATARRQKMELEPVIISQQIFQVIVIKAREQEKSKSDKTPVYW